jgi:hypothetical protein
MNRETICLTKWTLEDCSDLRRSACHPERPGEARGARPGSACVVTLGAAGALLVTPAGRWHTQGPPVHVVSTIGSGDAFLGGLVSALTGGWQETLRDAVVIRFLSPEAPPRRYKGHHLATASPKRTRTSSRDHPGCQGCCRCHSATRILSPDGQQQCLSRQQLLVHRPS